MKRQSFPQIGQKHRFTPLITAKQHAKGLARAPGKAIFVYGDNVRRSIKAALPLKADKVDKDSLVTRDRKLIVTRLPLGAPITAGRMEQLIARGTKQFLILGAAGAVGEGLGISDIVLCTRAIRDEGASHHYIKSAKYAMPDKKLTWRIGALMNESGMAFSRGTTWTIDTFYAETKEELAQYRKEGVLTVEMEAATLFAVAAKRKVSAAAVFAISDTLGERWSGFGSGALSFNRRGCKRLAEIAKLFKKA
jgi:purine-nucleoside phosphorylase